MIKKLRLTFLRLHLTCSFVALKNISKLVGLIA